MSVEPPRRCSHRSVHHRHRGPASSRTPSGSTSSTTSPRAPPQHRPTTSSASVGPTCRARPRTRVDAHPRTHEGRACQARVGAWPRVLSCCCRGCVVFGASSQSLFPPLCGGVQLERPEPGEGRAGEDERAGHRDAAADDGQLRKREVAVGRGSLASPASGPRVVSHAPIRRLAGMAGAMTVVRGPGCSVRSSSAAEPSHARNASAPGVCGGSAPQRVIAVVACAGPGRRAGRVGGGRRG